MAALSCCSTQAKVFSYSFCSSEGEHSNALIFALIELADTNQTPRSVPFACRSQSTQKSHEAHRQDPQGGQVHRRGGAVQYCRRGQGNHCKSRPWIYPMHEPSDCLWDRLMVVLLVKIDRRSYDWSCEPVNLHCVCDFIGSLRYMLGCQYPNLCFDANTPPLPLHLPC